MRFPFLFVFNVIMLSSYNEKENTALQQVLYHIFSPLLFHMHDRRILQYFKHVIVFVETYLF